MGKKNNNNKSNDDADDTALLEKPKFQAVVLADAFDSSRLDPLVSSSSSSTSAVQLNTVPLLDYSMDCLAGNGVDEAFVVCTNDEQERQVHAWQRKTIFYSSSSSPSSSTSDAGGDKTAATSSSAVMQVTCIKDSSLTNAGDALRELYKRNVIPDNGKEPFLLMFGDTVTNIDVRPAIAEHQERKKMDSAAIMTLVLKETSQEAGIVSSRQDDLMIAMDARSNRILVYDNSTPSAGGGGGTGGDDDDDVGDDDDEDLNATLTIPCSFVAVHPTIEVSTQFLDTGMAICSPEVLGKFEDEFDYLNISQDFVTNCVAEEEEGLQTRIHAYVALREEYAARVLDLATYHAISRDLLRRWCHPVVPDNDTMTSSSTSNEEEEKKEDNVTVAAAAAGCYKLCGHPYLYKKDTSTVARSSTVTGPGMLGHDCHIAEDCEIAGSVIGNHCKVGAGSVIRDSHVWDNVVVGAGAKLEDAIVAQNAIIGEGATLSSGCVVGEGCVIGKGVVVPPYTRITLTIEDDPFGDDADDDGNDPFGGGFDDDVDAKASGGAQAETDTSVVGPDGKGHAWKPENAEKIRLESMGCDRLAQREKRQELQMAHDTDDFSHGGVGQDDDLEQAFSAYTEGAVTFEDTPSWMGMAGGAASAPVVVGRQKGVDVVQEMKDICLEFEDNPVSGDAANMENLAIELNSYKFSQNASYSDCTMASILAVLHKCEITKSTTDGKLVSTFTNKVKIWAPLLTKLSVGITEEKAIIHALEGVATSGGEMEEKLSAGTSFRFLLQILHDKEVLSEEAILEWASDRKTADDKTSAVAKLFQLESVQEFLEWLEEESEDEDSDEDSD
jgi:translation initiation factor eIF-2B subunit epsilon